MENITVEQLQKIHAMLNKMGLMAEKPNMVYSISKGRCTSSRDLTKNEARLFIQYLTNNDPCDGLIRKVYAIAYQLELIHGDTPEDRKMNAIDLNKFLMKSGAVKKELGKMNHAELVKVVRQFEGMRKNIHQTQANKATRSLLDELNIQTDKTRAAKSL